MSYLLLFLGFLLLIKGAQWLVDGATSLASRFGVSELVIGLTIVSMGTSMPELIVSIFATLEDHSGLVIGNVLGSNIANVLLILGITAIVRTLPVKRNTMLSEVPFSLAATLLVGFLANSTLWYEPAEGLAISRGDGIIILFFFLLFMAYVFVTAREDQDSDLQEQRSLRLPLGKSVLGVVAGVGALSLGGKWVVDGATNLAQLFGMSDTLIGLTVVGCDRFKCDGAGSNGIGKAHGNQAHRRGGFYTRLCSVYVLRHSTRVALIPNML